MRAAGQKLEDILATLKPLKVEWQDDTSRRVIARLETVPAKKLYSASDVQALLDEHFEDGLLICRLFLALSKDEFIGLLRNAQDGAGVGIKGYRADKAKFIAALISLGLPDAMAIQAERKPQWTDVLVERLRSGRGSAISGQKRGRNVEDLAEGIVKEVFGDSYHKRCSFVGARGDSAKCDFAIPSKGDPRILIEAKGYGATGSKMTDVIGDIQKIIEVKRSDTAFLFFTDGLTWNQRKNDLRKIVEFQNAGDITRIYTTAMVDQFRSDLRQLKSEHAL